MMNFVMNQNAGGIYCHKQSISDDNNDCKKKETMFGGVMNELLASDLLKNKPLNCSLCISQPLFLSTGLFLV